MINTPAENEPVTPAGNEPDVSVAPVPPPPTLYFIAVIALFIQTVWLAAPDPAAKLIVEFACTVIVPLKD